MFKIAQSQTYFWPVVVEAADSAGKRAKGAFDAEFKRLSQAEIETLIEAVRTGEITDAALVERVLVGWKGVQDEDGSDLPYSETNREKLLNIYPVRPSIVTAFFDSLDRGREKNLRTPRAGG